MLVVGFHGEDGRRARFAVGSLPLPGWHEALAGSLQARVGPAGGLRTLASADSTWQVLGGFMRFLAGLPRPPRGPRELTGAQVRAWVASRSVSRHPSYVWGDLRLVGQVLECQPLAGLLGRDALDELARRKWAARPAPTPGYSDGELARLLVAARRDVAAVVTRIRTGRRAVERLVAEARLGAGERGLAVRVADLTRTGVVPWECEGPSTLGTVRRRLAAEAFLTLEDLVPLLVLMVAVTGRNVESVKELPVEHTVLRGRAVQVRLPKRRRGPGAWESTVTWEIGDPERELHTPGGLYLLVRELSAPSRAFSGSRSIWSVWRHGSRAGVRGADEHYDPFAAALKVPLQTAAWVRRVGLRADAVDGQPSQPLQVHFGRLRTSVEARRTRHLGGHLPSAARSNTYPVLFRHYLRADPTTIAWSREVLAEAFDDAEQAALRAHREVAAAGPVVVTRPGAAALRQAGLAAQVAGKVDGGHLDTAWAACTDPEHGPVGADGCQTSFLDCFHCANCVVTPAHLPRLVALVEELARRRQTMSQQQWWARYGPAWAAIRHDVLARFTPQEVTDAAAGAPAEVMLDLVENPWSRP